MAHLFLHRLHLPPVGVPPVGGSPPVGGLHLGPAQNPLQVGQAVVLPPLPRHFLLRFSVDLPEGVRGSRITDIARLSASCPRPWLIVLPDCLSNDENNVHGGNQAHSIIKKTSAWEESPTCTLTLEMYIDISQEPLYTEIWSLEVKCRAPEWAQNADTHFVRACAIEMQVNRKLTGKMSAPSWSTLIKHRPLLRPKEPLSVDTLFGGQKQSFPEVRGWSHMLISWEN